jgi:hypothetical protein
LSNSDSRRVSRHQISGDKTRSSIPDRSQEVEGPAATPPRFSSEYVASSHRSQDERPPEDNGLSNNSDSRRVSRHQISGDKTRSSIPDRSQGADGPAVTLPRLSSESMASSHHSRDEGPPEDNGSLNSSDSTRVSLRHVPGDISESQSSIPDRSQGEEGVVGSYAGLTKDFSDSQDKPVSVATARKAVASLIRRRKDVGTT